MSIKINLLAEAQAVEEQRRRDPVKRGIWIGAFLVLVTLLWILKLQLDLYFQSAALARYEAGWERLEPRYKEVTTNAALIAVLEAKLSGLDRLSTNRFLWGNLLNSLQHTTVEGVQLSRVKGQQTWQHVEGVPAKGTTAKPRVSIEQITLTIDAQDWNPAEQTYNKYKEALSNSEYFLRHLRRGDGFVLVGTLGSASPERPDSLKTSVAFTLESRFPETRRDE